MVFDPFDPPTAATTIRVILALVVGVEQAGVALRRRLISDP